MTVNNEGRPDNDVASYGEAVERVTASEAKKEAESYALNLMGTIAVNVDNEKLSDADFRAFIRNTLKLTKQLLNPNGEPDGDQGT